MSVVTRGDSALWSIPIIDVDGQPYGLHGCTIWVTVKTSPDVPDAEALYQHSLSVTTGGEQDASRGMTLGPGGAEAGVVIQELTPAESAAFATGAYVYDVQVMTAEGRIWTLINGESETVIGDITHAITRPEATP